MIKLVLLYLSGSISWELGLSIQADAGTGGGAQIVSALTTTALSFQEITTALSTVTVRQFIDHAI